MATFNTDVSTAAPSASLTAHAYWLARADTVKSSTGLPLDFKRSKVYFERKKEVHAALPPTLAARFAGLDDLETRLYLASGLLGMMRRYAREDGQVLGMPVALERGVVYLPLALNVTPMLSFHELVELVRVEQRGMIEHAMGAEPLRELLGVAPAQNRHPLFSIAMEGESQSASELRTDVNFSIQHSPEGIKLVARHNPRLISGEAMERVARHVVSFLAQVFQEPSSPIGQVPYLSEAETQDVLTRLACGEASCIINMRLEQLVTRQAASTPDIAALMHNGESLSYGELEARANRLAHFLRREHRLADGDAVALCILPSFDMLIGLLAILKAGCTYVSLDPTFPLERLAHQCHISGARVLVTETALQAKLDALPLTHCMIDENAARIATEDASALPAPSEAGRIAYVMFTSGSTGIPKGIRMPHRSLVNLVTWQQQQSRIQHGERTLQRTSVAFDVSAQEIFSTLAFGGTLVVATAQERDDVGSLPQQLARNGVHRIFLPYVGVEQFAHAMLAQARVELVLKEVITAGEQVHVTMPIMRCFNQLGARFVNQYGPTETHVATSYTFDEVPSGWAALPPIGRPIANAKVYVLDDDMQPVPVGVAGELWIGGQTLAKGYANDEKLTTERFIDNPFCAGERLYRSGDIGRYVANGNIEFLGRADTQLKVRGYRIEPGEIELAALKLSAVRAAAVVALADEGGGKRLALYLAAHAGSALPVSQVRAHLAECLPEHMVPSAQCIVILAELPLTATGKLDKRALPMPARTRPEVSSTFVKSRNEIETRIAGIWCNVLELEEVGTHDSFAELGGHSLLAIRALTQVNAAFGIKLPLNVLLRGTSVARLAAQVAEHVHGAGTAPAADVPADGARVTQYRMPNGQDIVCRVPAEAKHFYEDIFEREIYFRHEMVIRDGDVVVDVGANIGMFTIYALAKAKLAHIYAFEPAPELAPVLRANFGKEPAVTLFECALGQSEGQADFTYYPNATGMSSFYADADEESQLFRRIIANQKERGVTGMADILEHADEFVTERFRPQRIVCPVRTLSSVMAEQGIDRIDVLKIDVQKSELDVLLGIADADWPKIQKIVIEAHQLQSRVDTLTALLQRKGFEVVVEEDDLYRGSVIRFIYAVRGK